tara:strand:+ start:92 stop:271 length:180 start_codon:yes stop_codon:yes gene_type:complete
MTAYTTVWTAKKIADYVTMAAVNKGGFVIELFDKQVDAECYARELNGSAAAGYYCVVID